VFPGADIPPFYVFHRRQHVSGRSKTMHCGKGWIDTHISTGGRDLKNAVDRILK
jgi:hypothetical protein